MTKVITVPTKNVAKLVSTLTLANKHNASLVGQVLSDLTDKDGATLIATANHIFDTSKKGSADQRINTLNKTIKRITTKEENFSPLKLSFDRKTRVYSLVEYISKSSQKSTFEKIIALIDSEKSDLTQLQVQKLGQALLKSIEVAK